MTRILRPDRPDSLPGILTRDTVVNPGRDVARSRGRLTGETRRSHTTAQCVLSRESPTANVGTGPGSGITTASRSCEDWPARRGTSQVPVLPCPSSTAAQDPTSHRPRRGLSRLYSAGSGFDPQAAHRVRPGQRPAACITAGWHRGSPPHPRRMSRLAASGRLPTPMLPGGPPGGRDRCQRVTVRSVVVRVRPVLVRSARL